MNKMNQLQDEINQVIRGKEEVVRKVLAAILAEGHILMEDIPGVGKTTLATAFAQTRSMDYKRVQFTPDVLPSDILGFSMYHDKNQEFVFHKGSVFTNLFLADEINRTSPKTQSALLEVMEERHATVDGVTYELPDPFVVIATENPYGSSGTQMLPESQLDRFMIRISMGYPSHQDAVNILKSNHLHPISHVKPVMDLENIRELRKKVNDMYVHDSIYEYIVTIVEETRNNVYFSMGASPRGSIALLRMAKAMAVIDGRDFVQAEDVQGVAGDVLGHRVALSARARGERLDEKDAILLLLKDIKPPRNK